MRKRTGILIFATIAVMAAAVYGAVGSEISFVNEMKTGSVQIKIDQYEITKDGERLIGPGTVLANRSISYIPRVTNLRADSYVRVRADIEMDRDVDEPITLNSVYGINDGWIRAGEYFYYTKPMKPNETADVFKGIKVPADWREENAGGFKISLTADAVQAVNFTPDFDSATPWGRVEIQTEKESDDITYRTATGGDDAGAPGKIMCVNEDLLLESDTANLFEGFKYFMAGDSFSDSLKIQNKSDEKVRLSFCTETQKSSLVERAMLEINCENRNYYSGSLTTEPLYEYREIMELSPGETKALDFEVALPKDSDNGYSVLNDEVVWKFKVESLENKGGSGSVIGQSGAGVGVKTGDDTSMTIMFIIAGVAAAVIALVVIASIRTRTKNR